VPTVIVLALLLAALPVHAHTVAPTLTPWRWTFEPWVVGLLGISLALYIAGALRLRNRNHRPELLRREVACFLVGWSVMTLALVSPIDALGSFLFSAHMVQHELLMVIAAPMLILGRPLAMWAWSLPGRARHHIGEIVHFPAVRLPWRLLTHAATTWLLHALAVWLWHVPAFFNAALTDDSIHSWQHFSFLFTALLFWWTVLSRSTVRGAQAAVFYLFTTMVHTGALGALLTFSSALWYDYARASSTLGLDPLADQQLGGLIMWIPGGIVYALVGLMLGTRWLARAPVSFPAVR
jgi:putative membrane protein